MMRGEAYTFIVVPDATAQSRRYLVPKTIFSLLGVIGIIVLIAATLLIHTLFSGYKAMSKRAEQVEKLKKISLSQKNTIERYEDDIVQLSKNLAHIKQLNSRLMILTGLDPAEGENNLGLGGSEEGDSKGKEQQSEENTLEEEP